MALTKKQKRRELEAKFLESVARRLKLKNIGAADPATQLRTANRRVDARKRKQRATLKAC